MSAQPLDPNKQSADIGIVSTRGGIVVLDALFTVEGVTGRDGKIISEFCATFFTGTGGDILFESEDGTVNPYLATAPSQVLVVKAKKVLSTAILNGDTYITNAASMTWHGGQ
jgi:hypothetical protein